MNGKFLLDTNIAIAFLTADESLQRPDSSAQLFISCTAIGELFYGALNSNKIDENIQRLVDFIRDMVSVPCDDETARVYGEIKTALRRKGHRFPIMIFGSRRLQYSTRCSLSHVMNILQLLNDLT